MTSSGVEASTSDSDGDADLAQLVEEVNRRLERGENVEEFLQRFPHDGPRMREMLPAMELLAALARDESQLERAAPSEFGETRSKATAACELQKLGDFRILREIGRGGMGVVYLAEQLSLNRPVALKILPLAAAIDSRQLQRFRNEVQAAALLQHQNIVPIYFVGSENGVHFYAMQYIDGCTLDDLVRQLGEEDCETIPLFSMARSPDGDSSDGRDVRDGSGSLGLSRSSSSVSRRYRYRRIAELFVQAADALDHAHRRALSRRATERRRQLSKVDRGLPPSSWCRSPGAWP